MRNLARIPLSLTILAIVLSLAAPPGTFSASKKETKDQQREEIRKMSSDTLARLYKVQPSAKAAIQQSAGHAVFSNFGMKIFVAGGGSGKGLAVDNRTKKETFMKMIEVQAGLGMGIKKFRQVWVFETHKALEQFVYSGWELGGQATAAAKAGEQGASLQGALAVAPGVWLYQLTGTGLALELTAKGTKYYRNDDLNQ